MAIKRIHRELADLKASQQDLGTMTLGLLADNLFHWKATIPGPADSVYEGGLFEVVSFCVIHHCTYSPMHLIISPMCTSPHLLRYNAKLLK